MWLSAKRVVAAIRAAAVGPIERALPNLGPTAIIVLAAWLPVRPTLDAWHQSGVVGLLAVVVLITALSQSRRSLLLSVVVAGGVTLVTYRVTPLTVAVLMGLDLVLAIGAFDSELRVAGRRLSGSARVVLGVGLVISDVVLQTTKFVRPTLAFNGAVIVLAAAFHARPLRRLDRLAEVLGAWVARRTSVASRRVATSANASAKATAKAAAAGLAWAARSANDMTRRLRSVRTRLAPPLPPAPLPPVEDPDPSKPGPWWRDLRSHVDVLALVAVAAYLGLRGYQLYAAGWYPLADQAAVVLRSGDVFGVHTPLIGMPSGFGNLSKLTDPPQPHHPGPMVFWVIAPLAAVFGTVVPAVLASTWALAVGSASLVVSTARRLSGHVGSLLSVVFLAFVPAWAVVWPLDPLNPVMAALPYFAALFLTWALVHGDTRQWPWFVVVISFIVQSDLAYLPAAVVLVALAARTTLTRIAQARREPLGTRSPVLSRRTCIGVVIALVVSWALPLGDAILHRGGNVVELYRAGRAGLPTGGVSGIWTAAGTLLNPAPHTLGWSLESLAGLAVLIALYARHRRVGVAESRLGSLRTTAWGAAVAGLLTGAFQPLAATEGNALYRLPLEIGREFIWLSVAIAALTHVPPRGTALNPALRRAKQLARTSLVLFGGVSLMLTSIHPKAIHAPTALLHPAPRALAAELVARRPGATFAIAAQGVRASAVVSGLLVATRDSGISLLVQPHVGQYLGAFRSVRWSDQPRRLVLTTFAIQPPAPDARLVARWSRSAAGTDELSRSQARVASIIRSHAGLAVDPSKTIDVEDALRVSRGYFGAEDPKSEIALHTAAQRLIDDPRSIAALPDGLLVQLGAESTLGPLPELDRVRHLVDELASVTSVWELPSPAG